MMLDELIEHLQSLRLAIGINAPVRLSIAGRSELTDIDYVRASMVGKATPHRTVLRGGVPVVLISE